MLNKTVAINAGTYGFINKHLAGNLLI